MDTTQPAPETRLHFLDYWRVIRTRKVILFLVFLLVVVTVFTITLFQPKIYMAAVRIKVEPERPTVQMEGGNQMPIYDPFFLQTQYEILQSQKVLYPVIERLNLQQHWGVDVKLPEDMAFRRLKGALAVRRFRDTSLIEISVYDREPALAAQIANTIADYYKDERQEVKREDTQKGIDKLRDEVAQQEERVHQAQEKVEKYRRELGVPVINQSKLNDQTLQSLESKLTEARNDVAGLQEELNEVEKLTPRQLRGAVTKLISDSTAQTLLQNLTDIETRLETSKEDYGPEHPTVLALIATRDKLLDQLNDRLEGIKAGIAIELAVAKAHADDLQKQLDDAKNADLILQSEKYLPFLNAERDEGSEIKLYEGLKGRMQEATVEMELPRSPVEVIDHAEAPLPSMYVKPNIWLNVGMGAAAGLVFGIGLAFFIEFLDTSIKRIEDIEKYLGLPVLGVVGQQAGLLHRGNVSMSHLEAYRMMRTNIEFAKPEGAPTSFCVLSAGAGEGKSFTIANLAFVYAQHGARVLVVDSDLRRPGVHEHLGVANNIGLADYLSGAKSVQDIIQPTETANLWLIAAGGGSSARAALHLLTSQRMAELIRQVVQQFDVVIYDTPPILGVSDAAVMTREVGMSLLVVQHRRYPRNMARRAVQVIQNAGGKLLGCVVNNIQLGHDETYYYYHDHYHDQLEFAQHTRELREKKQVAATKPSGGDEIDLSGKY
ncbi:MAG: polysaccharide biosynthesis tyrosine autokinase [Verrucomicrobiia bacterium]